MERRPGRLAVASDEDWRPRWRVGLLPSYKAHRVAEPVPPELEPQMPVIHERLRPFAHGRRNGKVGESAWDS